MRIIGLYGISYQGRVRSILHKVVLVSQEDGLDLMLEVTTRISFKGGFDTSKVEQDIVVDTQ